MATHTTAPSGTTTLAAEAIAGLRQGLRCLLIIPDHPAYDEARIVRNGLIDRP